MSVLLTRSLTDVYAIGRKRGDLWLTSSWPLIRNGLAQRHRVIHEGRK